MIVFQNAGTLDPRSIKTFGVSSKDTSNPIGFFGTGLKYAIAVLLRHKQAISIISEGKPYKFTTQKVRIRNDEFDFIYMNDEELGFTTELGKTWELWQAFRELYSNMLDEAGTHCEVPDMDVVSLDNRLVTITVTGRAFEQIYFERNKYFLDFPSLSKDHGNDDVQVFERPSSGLYYRGILVGSMEGTSELTYNLLRSQKLTEDRTLVSNWNAAHHIGTAIVRMTDNDMLRKALLAGQGSWESHINLNYSGTPSPEFCTFVRTNKHNRNLNPTALDVAKKAPGGEDLFEAAPCELFPHEVDILSRAHKLVNKIQGPVRYPVVVTEELSSTTLAYVVHGGDTIYLNRILLAQGVTRVASGLFEENAHLQRGLRDETREMQNFFLETLFGVVERLP